MNDLPADPLSTVVVIPARGGSKGVPGKNMRRVGGRPLVTRAIEACRSTRWIDAIYVSTDDQDIALAATEAGAEVINRPDNLAGDTASSESAVLHVLQQLAVAGIHPDVLVLLQCTSPFIFPADLDRAVELIMNDRADSAFSAAETYEFLWRSSGSDGLVTGQNHDPSYRPRRQDREPDFRETGAFYAVSVAGFRASRHRFFGRTAAVEVPQLSAIEIDSEQDLELANALAPIFDTSPSDLDVDAVITDFDGVHTDDSAFVDQDGRESVRVSRADGLGIELLREAGVPLLIVSKETNAVVRARAAKLGLEVRNGVGRKTEVVQNWLAGLGIPPERAAYLGNDINDCGPMGFVGWPVAVADARPEVRQLARLILTSSGGHGAVRELCDLVLDARRQRKSAFAAQRTAADVPMQAQATAAHGGALAAADSR
jgi:YrbI family 3-deoxy-D-manno-octulosonate 8-phosphate phosphatase